MVAGFDELVAAVATVFAKVLLLRDGGVIREDAGRSTNAFLFSVPPVSEISSPSSDSSPCPEDALSENSRISSLSLDSWLSFRRFTEGPFKGDLCFIDILARVKWGDQL